MTPYYSGAPAFNVIQNNPDLSLGGWKSSTPIPNNMLNNLFGSVSEKAQNEQLSETKGIFLMNETGSSISNLTIYSQQGTDDIVIFEFSDVSVSNGQSMERISSVRSQPFYADFFQANGVDNATLLVDSLAANAVIGLWVRRTALQRPLPPQVSDLNNQNDPFNVWYNKLQVKMENPTIMLSWS